MFTPNLIYEVLESRRIELGLSQAQASKAINGRSDSSFFQALKRGSIPSASRLASAADALGLEFYFGPPLRTTPIDRDLLYLTIETAEEALRATGKEMEPKKKAKFVLAVYGLFAGEHPADKQQVIDLVNSLT